jgi:hypothetical protein
MMVLWEGGTHSSALSFQTQQVGERGDDLSCCFVLTMWPWGRGEDRGASTCLRGRPEMEGLCVGRSENSLTKSWSLIRWTC